MCVETEPRTASACAAIHIWSTEILFILFFWLLLKMCPQWYILSYLLPVCSFVLRLEAQLLFIEVHRRSECSCCWQANCPLKTKSFFESWTPDGWIDPRDIFKLIKWIPWHIMLTWKAHCAAFILVLLECQRRWHFMAHGAGRASQ